MKILHLCSDYANTSLYERFVAKLDSKGYRQIVYMPVRAAKLIGVYQNPELSLTEYAYPLILNSLTRINYFHKIRKIVDHVTKSVEINTIDLIHAHFLFSDGGAALLLKKRYGLNYIVTVRNTDLNVFFKYLFHTRSYGIQILKEAHKIIIICPFYKGQIKSYLPENEWAAIDAKITEIPNGIDDDWFTHAVTQSKTAPVDRINLLYVGEYARNKNIQTVIQAVNVLRKSGIDCYFEAVGEYGHYCKKIKNLLHKYPFMRSFPLIKDKEKLRQKYRNADIFIMPSFYETFGLVYPEAMSQGVPVIYTKGQGIDGYFPPGVIGYPVNPHSINEICMAIRKVLVSYSRISQNCLEKVTRFSWEKIIEEYIAVYQNIPKNK